MRAIGKVIRVLAWLTILSAISWSVLAIGNGKVGTIFGNELFLAAKDDMMLALILNIAAAGALIILAILSLLAGRKSRAVERRTEDQRRMMNPLQPS